MKKLPCLSLLLTAAAGAHASDTDFALRHGIDGGQYESTTLSLRFGPRWSTQVGGWETTLRPELEMTRFRYTGGADAPKTVDSLGGIALLRFVRPGGGSVRPYAEIGLGLSAFSRDSLGTKGFSTHWQFSEHIGAGLEFRGGWFVGYRFSHYSNARIALPNDGMDLHQLMIGARF